MKKSMNTVGLGLSLLIAFAVAACGAASPPRELVDARSAYKRAVNSPASQLAPGELYEAKVALKRAEAAYEEDAESAQTRTYAYVAQRKSELAEVEAATLAAAQQAKMEERTRTQAQAKEMTTAKEELEMTRAELEAERAARAEAEARTREAVEKLVASGAAASVRQDARGVVLTLSGQVLFPTGQSELRPRAQERLKEVSEALNELPKQQIVAEGHTDSTGTPERNMELSVERAEAVREYLISQGVTEDRITARGLGQDSPIADNSTPEGRAENRRVELIIQSAVPGEQPQMQQPQMQQPQMQQPMPTP